MTHMKTAGLVRTTYEIITPESAEEGDAEERGWIDEEGTECTPEEAFKMCRGCEPSSSQFQPGVWYTDNEYSHDYQTGATESRSYHLKGFTKQQEEDIFDSVEEGSWVGLDEDDEVGYAADPVEDPNQLRLFESATKLISAARTLLAADDYSEEELAALSIMGMNKPSYRAVEFKRAGLGEYTKDSPVLKSLVAKGLVKFTATGIQLDKPLAVAVMKRHPAPEKYKGQLSNYSMQFKRKEEPGEEDEDEDTSTVDVTDGAAWDRAKGAATLIAMARKLLAAEGTMGSADFIELLKSKLTVGDRKVSFQNHGNQIFLNYINLPVKLSNGGAEAENNRIMLAIEGFGKGENEPAPSGKVNVKLVVAAVRDANQGRLKLRAKSGTPEQIAKYVADFLNGVAKDIQPNYTHTGPDGLDRFKV